MFGSCHLSQGVFCGNITRGQRLSSRDGSLPSTPHQCEKSFDRLHYERKAGTVRTTAGVAVAVETVVAHAAEGAGGVDTGRVRCTTAVMPQTLVVIYSTNTRKYDQSFSELL